MYSKIQWLTDFKDNHNRLVKFELGDKDYTTKGWYRCKIRVANCSDPWLELA